jgi:hypothetical protein
MPKEVATSSSITTAVPSGLITTDWCVQDSLGWHDEPNVCADSDTNPSDYGTICCAGDIVDTSGGFASITNGNSKTHTLNLDTLVCCHVEGPQQGGFFAIATDRTQCTEGVPTPLASFAATNTANAAIWEATYTSASVSEGESTTLTGDFIHRETPKCLWVYTKTGVAMQNVTVAAADITTLPAPTTDEFGYTITTGSLAPSNTAGSSLASSSTDAAASTISTSGAASAYGIIPVVCLFIMAFGFFRAATP